MFRMYCSRLASDGYTVCLFLRYISSLCRANLVVIGVGKDIIFYWTEQENKEKSFLILTLHHFSSKNILIMMVLVKNFKFTHLFLWITNSCLPPWFFSIPMQCWIFRVWSRLKIVWLVWLMTTHKWTVCILRWPGSLKKKHMKTFIVQYLANLSGCFFSPYGHLCLGCQLPCGDSSKWAPLLEFQLEELPLLS